MNIVVQKKPKQKLEKNKVFHYELLSMIVFHNYVKRVKFLEKWFFTFIYF
jgi:hypothetical protein